MRIFTFLRPPCVISVIGRPLHHFTPYRFSLSNGCRINPLCRAGTASQYGPFRSVKTIVSLVPPYYFKTGVEASGGDRAPSLLRADRTLGSFSSRQKRGSLPLRSGPLKPLRGIPRNGLSRPPLSPSAGVFHPRNAPESQRRLASRRVFEWALGGAPLQRRGFFGNTIRNRG
jgi:hypothetical protein